MKADVRYCSVCMLNSLIMEMNLFHASKELQKKEFTKFLKELPDREGETPITIQDSYIRRLHDLAGYDFYKEMREKDDREMLQLSEQVMQIIDESADPFKTALKFAIFGNLIDPAGQSEKSAGDVLREAISIPLAIDDSDQLTDRLKTAKNIFYVADNAGEVVMDRIFIEYMKENILPEDCRLFYGVRGTQVHNDVRETDARIAGIDQFCTLVNPENTYAGAMIEESSPAYQEAYHKADIVFSKGMGNYETLEERNDKIICFLLVAKCVPISEHLGVDRGMPVCKLKQTADN